MIGRTIGPARRSIVSPLAAILVVAVAIPARCALLEMSRTLWSKAVHGDLTEIGRLDPLRVPLIKVDQSEGDTSYRLVLRNLEIAGLNGSTLESVRVARGAHRSDPSEQDYRSGYVSYSDHSDSADSIEYRFHTKTRRPGGGAAPRESLETVYAPANRAGGSSRPDDDERQRQQYERRTSSRLAAMTFTAGSGDVRGGGSSSRASSYNTQPRDPGYPAKRPAHVQPVYGSQRAPPTAYVSRRGGSRESDDCDETGEEGTRFGDGREDDRQHGRRRDGGYHDERVGEVFEVSASEMVESRLKNRHDVRPPVSYNRKQPPVAGNVGSAGQGARERSDYIDIIYADDRANGSTKRFGNLGVDPRENRRVYDIERVMKEIRERARLMIHNLTEGEALTTRNDMFRAAMEARRLKDMSRYARNHQEQQGYFEEGMQLIYHYGGIDARNDTGAYRDSSLDDTRRTKRAHPEGNVEDDVMHVILRIRVPLLRVKSQYTLAGKVGKRVLRGNGLLTGNFTDLVGDFMLELKRMNDELIIVRAAKAKLTAKGNNVTLQGMDEEGPVRTVLSHGLMAAEAVAAMLADDFATKGLNEKTADAIIYRMYKDLPAN